MPSFLELAQEGDPPAPKLSPRESIRKLLGLAPEAGNDTEPTVDLDQQEAIARVAAAFMVKGD